jgi:hypothetical protein
MATPTSSNSASPADSLNNLRAATHVAFDTTGADRLLDFGLTNLVRACDCLTTGPSRRDVLKHIRARESWFGSTEKWDDLYSKEVRWEMPVVVWATPCLNDRLNLWKTCSWLRDRGIPCRDVLIIDLPPRPPSPRAKAPRMEPFDCIDSVFYQSDEALLAHLAAARPWRRERYDQAVKLWEQYVSADPRRFARRCLRGVRGFPELGPLWAFLSRFFPRLSAAGTLRLSRYDELLLRALSVEWQTPAKVFVGDVLQQHWEFIACVGDLTLEHRLAAWASHRASSVVERAPGPKPEDTHGPMLSHVYRLTERMQLRAGLPRLTDAPRLPVGGAEAYAPEAPWVLLDDGRLVLDSERQC